jgi:hypothetical protein
MIAPGVRVRVAVPAGCRDPWVTQKADWRGDVVGAAEDIGPDVWRVRFVPPWCELDLVRVMPGVALEVVEAPARAGAVTGMGVGARVRVKAGAGSEAGEEHIVRVRGRVGAVIRECVLAASCIVAEFSGAPRPVMIPRKYLDAVQAGTVKQKAGGQIRLPMGM